ncbi:CHC2 zinc finger domain-containing protein [Micromonospora sp. WMMA1363]|uniref:CHC2 zinc finger domain-containing protein n=1 Tax=Micromonospora sp. WMMA1363 TaxID=3053985 RepID=UPI00338DACCD
MRCPFQETDRNPSASVNTLLERFSCFACGVNEDAYGLVIWRGDSSDFLSAKQFIEDLYGERYGDVPQQFVGGRGKGRRRVFDESSDIPGQHPIFPTRTRREPLSGA